MREKRPTKEVITKKEIYRVAQEQLDIEQVRVFFYLSYLTAARVSEICPLKKGHINKTTFEGEEIIEIRLRNLKNKYQKTKIVPAIMLSDSVEAKMWKEIKKYILGFSEYDFIFPFLIDEKGEARRRAAYNQISKIKLNLEITLPNGQTKYVENKKLNPHYLRHCRITHFAAQGLSPAIIKKIAGWSDLRPFRAYEHLTTTDIIYARIRAKKEAEK